MHNIDSLGLAVNVIKLLDTTDVTSRGTSVCLPAIPDKEVWSDHNAV